MHTIYTFVYYYAYTNFIHKYIYTYTPRLCPPYRSAYENSRCIHTTVLPRRHSLVRLDLGHPCIRHPYFIPIFL